ncbi:GAP family protein [Kribbella sp. NPDC050281]|uniref:GAP family protein n=1 Tax=Kribbella sp. NPDC050281 TaxID=3155515 RepID=UPI0033D06EA2
MIVDPFPLAVAVALSPVPVIATLLMLLARRSTDTGLGFLLGWTAGIAVVTTVSALFASTSRVEARSDTSPMATDWILLWLGLLLLLLGIRGWSRRRRSPAVTTRPRWMDALDSFSRVRAAGLGVVLSALNPKNLAICAVAGAMIGDTSGETVEQVAAIAVFVVIATSTVALPVLSYLVARDRLRPSLDRLREWLEENSRAVVSALFVAIGLVLLAQALISLAG